MTSRAAATMLAAVLAMGAAVAVEQLNGPTSAAAAARNRTVAVAAEQPSALPRSTPTTDTDLTVTTPRRTPATAVATAARSRSGTGPMLTVAGTSVDPVDRGGPEVTFSVEVQAATGLDPAAVTAQVEAALYDERSWARDLTLRRVAPAQARIRVVVATPDSTDALCARAGLQTNGRYSCFNGRVAAINLTRWTEGVDHVDDLDRYRRYVVNHEVGHGLGHDHRGCPRSGGPAPVMAQQTKSLDGCTANGWPHPG